MQVERRNVEKQSWILVGETEASTMTITARKLTEGHQYLFRVTAENIIGVSEPCVTDEPITAKLPFGQCIDFTYTQPYCIVCVHVFSTYRPTRTSHQPGCQ